MRHERMLITAEEHLPFLSAPPHPHQRTSLFSPEIIYAPFCPKRGDLFRSLSFFTRPLHARRYMYV